MAEEICIEKLNEQWAGIPQKTVKSIFLGSTKLLANSVTQSMLLHNDIPGYDLPAIDFVSPSKEAQKSHILKEQDAKIFTHLEKVLIHMIDEKDVKIFKSHKNYVQNK